MVQLSMSDIKNKELAKGSRDTLFAAVDSGSRAFSFDENVANVFDDMIHRSLPGYDAILAMIGVLADRYVQEGTNCYDLGCSLGGVTFSIVNQLKDKQCQLIAVDNSAAMIDKMRERVAVQNLQSKIDIRQEDIRETEVNNASVVVINFVLQFLDPEQRTPVLKTIYDGMLPGSILVLSEKIKFDDKQENEFQIDMHHQFKKLHGYSDMEISEKRAALENVLIPDSLDTIKERLVAVGFSKFYLWFQCFNFTSIVAIK